MFSREGRLTFSIILCLKFLCCIYNEGVIVGGRDRFRKFAISLKSLTLFYSWYKLIIEKPVAKRKNRNNTLTWPRPQATLEGDMPQVINIFKEPFYLHLFYYF